MIIRICLVVAILGGLATAGLSIIGVRHQMIAVAAERDREKGLKETAERSLGETRATLAGVSRDLKGVREELGAVKVERDRANAKSEEEATKASGLAERLKKTEAQWEETKNELAAWRFTGFTVDQIKPALAALKGAKAECEALTAENKILQLKLTKMENRIAGSSQSVEVCLPEDLKGGVSLVDPKYGFVILDIGENQQVKEGGKLLVHREGKLISKVVIKRVEATRSIADIVPGWNLAEIREGDQVLVR